MIKVVLVNHCDVVPDLVDLFNLVFSGETSIEMWEWKHLQNPLNRSQHKVIVAVDNGKIVGARPFMLANLKVHNRTFLVGQPCDTMVHPEYRRKGIFAKMNHLAIKYAKELGLALFYNFPNQYSGPGNLKQGWQKIMPCERLIRFENPVGVAKAKFGSGLGSTIIGGSYGILFGSIPRRKHYDKGKTWQIEISNKAVDKLEGLGQLYQEQCIEFDRSLSYLEWRIDSHPRHEYRYVMCSEGDQLVGYVLVGVPIRKNELRVGQIVDYAIRRANSDCIYPLFDRAVDEMLGMGCDMLSTWAPASRAISDTLKRFLGFRSSFDFPLRLALQREPLWLMAREVDAWFSSSVCIQNPAAWRLTPVFCDTA